MDDWVLSKVARGNLALCKGVVERRSIAAIAYVCAALSLAHLLLEYAVEDEDEHALQGVEDGEEVGHDDGALVDVHQAEGPGQAQQTQ